MSTQPLILYEDNHLLAVYKHAGEIVHADQTGDESIVDRIKQFIKERDKKPGNVFLAAVHRLDRPVSGVLLLAKTSKALSRMGQEFKKGNVDKVYWAITKKQPPQTEGRIVHFLGRNKKNNTAFIAKPKTPGAKKATLDYRMIGHLANMFLLEISLQTGRHHQIRAQLRQVKCPIIGDIKYGAPEPLEDLSIGLQAKKLQFHHPVHREPVTIEAPLPDSDVWRWFQQFDPVAH